MRSVVLGGSALILALMLARGSHGPRPPAIPSSDKLSERRARALGIVEEVVPSTYPEQRFKKLSDWQPGDDYTTCGALPGYVGVRLGDPGGITRWGVEGARTEGVAKGAWVQSDGRRRPRPGDIYGVEKVGGDILVHVGIVRRIYRDAAGREIWETADAGQGADVQAARFVLRVYDPASNTLTRLDGGEPRFVAGWIDLDAFPIGVKRRLRAQRGAAWKYPVQRWQDPNERRL